MTTETLQPQEGSGEGSTEGENDYDIEDPGVPEGEGESFGEVAERLRRDDPVSLHPDHEELPFQIGDPVMDSAQGRPMVVIGTPDLTVREWSEQHQYDLTDNYGNQKFGVHTDEPVVACRYVSDVSSDPSKTYTFPQSRLRLIDVHHADDGRRIYDRVAVDVLRSLFGTALVADWDTMIGDLRSLARGGTELDDDLVDEALELADVDRRFGGDDGG